MIYWANGKNKVLCVGILYGFSLALAGVALIRRNLNAVSLFIALIMSFPKRCR